MLFRPAYNGLFEVSDVILPNTRTSFRQWFGDEKMTFPRAMVFMMLTRHVTEGRFLEPGMYLMHVYRIRLRIRGTLYKFPMNATLETIAAYLRTAKIEVEGLTNVTIPIDPRSIDPRLN